MKLKKKMRSHIKLLNNNNKMNFLKIYLRNIKKI